MSLNFIYSNKTEDLAESLMENLFAQSMNPFEPLTVVVQGKGMERYLSQRIAEKFGICMNVKFPFPKKVFRQIFERLFLELVEGKYYLPSNDEVTWELFRNLKIWAQENPENFGSVLHFLKNDDTELKRFQFCSRVANLFDQYSAFRPELVRSWLNGKQGYLAEDLIWQMDLWLKMFKNNPSNWVTPVQLLHEVFQDAKRLQGLGSSFSTLRIFGISTLPELYIQLLEKLGEVIDIFIYLPYACEEPTFEDGQTSRRIAYYQLKESIKEGESVEFSSESGFTVGNTLSIGMGEQAGVFMNRLIDGQWTDYCLISNNEDPSPTMLKLLQKQMEVFEQPEEKQVVTPDHSVQFHISYSPLREAEVLREFLLNQFDQAKRIGESLDPSEILVMVPDIEKYGPCLHAVLSNDDPCFIPFTVADQSVRTENEYAELILKLFELRASRFTAEEVLQFLELGIVMQFLEIEESQVLQIREILRKSQFRWGMDSKHSKEYTESDLSIYSWEKARDRILLGVIILAENRELYEESLPLGIEEDNLSLAIRLVEFVDILIKKVKEISETKTLDGWASFLDQCRQELFPENGVQADKLRSLNLVIYKLRDLASLDGEMELSAEVFYEYLLGAFDETHAGKGFLKGNVTICEMRPMRSIPAKIVCLLGMNDGDFPRSDQPLSFDQMHRKRKLSDRSQTREDRNLFLEAILSAREILYVSWTGKSVRDSSEKPPSVLISDLMDHLDQSFTTPDLEPVSQYLRTDHRLHAFDPAYFKKENEFPFTSLNASHYKLAKQLIERERENIQLIDQDQIPEESHNYVSMEEVIRFFNNPSEYFQQSVLKSRKILPADSLIENELIFMDGLSDYQLREEISRDTHSCKYDARAYQQVGLIPAGIEGVGLQDQSIEEVKQFQELCSRYFKTEVQEVDINILIEGVRITGKLPISGNTCLDYRLASVKYKDRLRLWLKHLVSCIQEEESIDSCIGVYKNKVISYTPISRHEAIALLSDWVRLYKLGLIQPLIFFPESSFAFVETRIERERNPRKRTEPIGAAKAIWEATYNREPEKSTSPYSDFFDVDTVLYTDEFEKNSEFVYGALLERAEER